MKLYCCLVSSDQNEKVEILADDTSLSSEAIQEDSMNHIETDGQVNSNDRNLNSSSCSTNLSLQEKVAQFIQNGELDIIEGELQTKKIHIWFCSLGTKGLHYNIWH